MKIKLIKNIVIALICVGSCAAGAVSFVKGKNQSLDDHIIFLPNESSQAGFQQKEILPADDQQSDYLQTDSTEEEPPEPVADDGRIHLNSATKSELMTLQGIGATKADAILEYRRAYGSFKAIEEIMEVKGIGEGTFSKIKDNLAL